MSDSNPQPGTEETNGKQPVGWLVLNEAQWTVLLVLAVLAVALLSIVWSRPFSPETQAEAPSTEALVSPEKVPVVTGEEPVQKLFTRAGCPVCHTIPGIHGAEGRVGPKLVLGDTGPQRLAEPGYRGNAHTVREYVIESVLDPSAYVVPGYPDRAMPTWYGQKLTARALDKMADYLGAVTSDELRR